ncbi:MAG: hypothetical protein ACYTGL_03905 [Planctomycetota bacterium]|jgi:dynein heavy chain
MKSFISSLTALFMAATVIGCGDAPSDPGTADDAAADAMHEAMANGDETAEGHAAEAAEGEGDAAPAEGEGDAAPAEGEGDAAPAEGEGDAAPAEGEGDAAPAEEKSEDAPAEEKAE